MWSQQTRASLLLRLKDGTDDVAWREFDCCYRGLIVRYARQRGLQAADAEDVRQAVMLNFARALQGFTYDPGKGRFRSYLGRVVRNAVTRHRNRASATSDLDESVEDPRPDDQDPVWEREWMLHHYRTAMGTLRTTMSPRSVAVFDRLLGGASIADVAGHFSLTADAVHKIKQRVRDRLRAQIDIQVSEE